MSQTQQTNKQKYIRAVTRTKADQYLSVAIPPKLSKRLELDATSYVSIYVDELNNLIFRKIQEV